MALAIRWIVNGVDVNNSDAYLVAISKFASLDPANVFVFKSYQSANAEGGLVATLAAHVIDNRAKNPIVPDACYADLLLIQENFKSSHREIRTQYLDSSQSDDAMHLPTFTPRL